MVIRKTRQPTESVSMAPPQEKAAEGEKAASASLSPQRSARENEKAAEGEKAATASLSPQRSVRESEGSAFQNDGISPAPSMLSGDRFFLILSLRVWADHHKILPFTSNSWTSRIQAFLR